MKWNWKFISDIYLTLFLNLFLTAIQLSSKDLSYLLLKTWRDYHTIWLTVTLSRRELGIRPINALHRPTYKKTIGLTNYTAHSTILSLLITTRFSTEPNLPRRWMKNLLAKLARSIHLQAVWPATEGGYVPWSKPVMEKDTISPALSTLIYVS